MTGQPIEASGVGPSWLRLALSTAKSPRARRIAQGVTLGAAAYEAATKARSKVIGRVTYTVAVNATDDIYDDLHEWLLSHLTARQRRSLVAHSQRRDQDRVQPVSEDDGRRRVGRPTALRVAYDDTASHTVRLDGHRVKVTVDRDSRLPSGVTLSASERDWFRPFERIVFTTYGVTARDALVAFLETLAARHGATETRPRFYVATRWGDWRRLSDLPSRPLDTVILREGQIEDLVADLARFLASEDEYARIGLPWHRGYLLHGPPGTGKTSLAKALAEHFRLDVHYVPLSDLEKDAMLLQLFGTLDARSMLVLEDVDVVHAARSRDDAESPGISLSGLLNALDGLVTPHGLVTIMTTNDLDSLDPALVRAGRADRVEELGPLDDEQLRRLVTVLLDRDASAPWTLNGRRVTHAELIEVAKPHLHDSEAMYLAIKQFLA